MAVLIFSGLYCLVRRPTLVLGGCSLGGALVIVSVVTAVRTLAQGSILTVMPHIRCGCTNPIAPSERPFQSAGFDTLRGTDAAVRIVPKKATAGVAGAKLSPQRRTCVPRAGICRGPENRHRSPAGVSKQLRVDRPTARNQHRHRRKPQEHVPRFARL